MENKVIAIVLGVVGFIFAVYLAGYCLFFTGIQQIIESAKIVNNSITIDNFSLLVNCLRIVVAPFVFNFFFNTAVLVASKVWNNSDEN